MHIPRSLPAIALATAGLIFSIYLMFHTFSYHSEKSEIWMSSHLWSDFGAHIPLIRSFSFGANWPPEYPIFPGEKIRYHFLFYLIAGLLERLGMRLDSAVNIPSALGMFFLLLGIYFLAVKLFKKWQIGVLSVLFFLFNGSLSFLKFFQSHPLSRQTMNEIIHIQQFPSFGPWDGGLITAFWSLNVYTNQRHLALSFAIVLGIIFLLLHIASSDRLSSRPLFIIHYSLFIAFLSSSLLFMNQPALLGVVIFSLYFFLFHPKTRVPLLLTAIFSLPFLFLFLSIGQPGGKPLYEIGYLVKKPVTLASFFRFWWHNLGLHLFLIPLGILLAPKRLRLFALSLIILFILPNLYRFSPDMINNHKFFNLFIIIGGMYTAWALYRLFILPWKIIKVIIVIIVIPLILSGLIDFFVVNNDYPLILSDIPKNRDALFIKEHTLPNAVVLNSTWFYHPASLAGRKIYNGYSFFTWSAGYTTYEREALVKDIYRSNNLSFICSTLQHEHIDYVELNDRPESFLQPISTVWKTLPTMYRNPETGVTLYDVKTICKTLTDSTDNNR